MKTTQALLRALAVTLAAGVLFTSSMAAQTVAIVGGTVHTVSGAAIPNGTVVIENDRITAVGVGVQVPPGARVIDASGKIVTPGLFDSATQLGVIEIGAEQNTVDGTTNLSSLTAGFEVVHGINPLSTLIPIARVEGITRAVVTPGSGAGMFAGTGAVIDLLGDRSSDVVVIERNAMYVVLGEQGAGYAGGSRAAAIAQLRGALESAREYGSDPSTYRAVRSEDEQMSRSDLLALAPVATGDRPLVVMAHRASDLLTALNLKDDLGIDLILAGALEGWMVAGDIASRDVPVIVNPMTNLPTFQSLGATHENAARLHAGGANVILASFDAHNARNIRQAAGMAVSYGMPHDAALRAVTLAPAALWGLNDYGSLEAGKMADVVVWSGDPFEVTSYAEHVFIDGVEVSSMTRQRALFEKYRTLDRLPPWR
jgi:imidazolonepropionase-like amidohydrolase